jgi:ssDNA-binding Zn-finger/Zn-ribbon topoisomerase 1
MVNPHPTPNRLRKAIKWGKYGGAAVTVLLVVAWIWSGWIFAVSPLWRRWSVAGGLGCVFLSREDSMYMSEHLSYWEWNPPFNRQWGFYFQWGPHYTNRLDRAVQVPLWAFAGAAMVSTLIAWRLDAIASRRERLGRCPKCNYERAGLGMGAVCPECGDRPKIG